MKKVSSRKHDRFGRVLDSDPVYLIAALVLMALLVSFYAVLLVNMNAIDTKTEDLKEHPYAVTVAAGRSETLLMQVRTLDDRLAFARTPETIASVKSEFASIDQDLRQAIEVIEQRHRGNPDKAHELASSYKEFCTQQEQLIAISLSDASDETVAEFLATAVNPRIDEMLDLNTEIIDAASQSFDRLYTTVNDTRQDAIFTATVLMAAVMVSLVLFFVVIRRKNRQQEELQESLRRAVQSAQEASEAKSRFLSNVSHDIRTPLTAIMGLTDIALEHADERDRVMESLEKVQLSSHHLLNLVNDVLDMSKIESGQIDLVSKPFDVRGVVETLGSIVRPQADSKHLTFSVTHVDVEDGLVLGDEMHVCQVLINLLGNAVKYTEPNGLVNFGVEELEGDEREGFAAEHGISLLPSDHDGFEMRVRLIRFIVEDDGIGMSKEFMSRMFDPFEREDVPTRFSVEGTGLGMAIVKNLADLMGGTVPPCRCKASAAADRASRWCCRSSLARARRASCGWSRASKPRARPPSRRRSPAPGRTCTCCLPRTTRSSARSPRRSSCRRGPRWSAPGTVWRLSTCWKTRPRIASTSSSWTSRCPAWTGSRRRRSWWSATGRRVMCGRPSSRPPRTPTRRIASARSTPAWTGSL